MDIKPYLNSIGLDSGVLVERAETAFGILAAFCQEAAQEIFVSEYVRDDGTRVYDNLWLFSSSYAMEAKHFFNDELDWDIACLASGVPYCRMQSKDYDFQKASASSRLRLDTTLPHGITLDCQATGENCDHLWRVINRIIRPRIV